MNEKMYVLVVQSYEGLVTKTSPLLGRSDIKTDQVMKDL